MAYATKKLSLLLFILATIWAISGFMFLSTCFVSNKLETKKHLLKVVIITEFFLIRAEKLDLEKEID